MHLPRVLFGFLIATAPCAAAADSLQSDLPRDFIPEGLAWDGARWLLGSVHLRRIDAVDARSGAGKPFVQDLDSVLGLHLSPDGRHLWAAASGLPEGNRKTARTGSGLWVFDLASGRRIARHRLPERDAKSSLGDFVFVNAHTLVASDGGTGALWRFDLRTQRYSALLPAGSFGSPQGLAPGRAASQFYLADFDSGLWLVGLDGTRTALAAPEGAELRGIDGLYRAGDRLIAVQNGTRTHRILMICLAAQAERVASVHKLVEGQADWDEPTLGEIVSERFFFVANSQWNKFDEAHRLTAPERLSAPRIAHVDLPADACAAAP